MLIKVIDERAYLFGKPNEFGDVDSRRARLQHCVGVMEPSAEEVTDPVLAHYKYHHLDVTPLADFSEMKDMTVMNDSEFKYSLSGQGKINLSLL